MTLVLIITPISRAAAGIGEGSVISSDSADCAAAGNTAVALKIIEIIKLMAVFFANIDR